MNPPFSSEIICVAAIVIALYMFHSIKIVVLTPNPHEVRIARLRYGFALRVLRNARTFLGKVGAIVLAGLALIKGTGKIGFITGGLILATGIVSGACPGLWQTIFEFFSKKWS